MLPPHNRRHFVAASAFTLVPRHALGGAGFVAPSDTITVAIIGTGTQALRELPGLLAHPAIRVTSVCDPCQYSTGYRDWSPDGLLKSMRKLTGKSNWGAGSESVVPGGRDAAKDILDLYYANAKPGSTQGVAAYADYRELLDKENDVAAVKIMTPDHLHGVVSAAAMRRGKHVLLHKPIANRLNEARAVIDLAKSSGVATHFLPWNSGFGMAQVKSWIDEGAIGTLREIHNWTNRPVWPQYAAAPEAGAAVPRGFDWNLWLGPEADRPYHPNYTHMVFRGWYDFGAGTMADMGHYSLWSVFNALQLEGPTVIEPLRSHTCSTRDNAAFTVRHDASFPEASICRFKFPARGPRPAVDLFWYDGGMRPQTPDEFDAEPKELPIEGMMFTGDKGRILTGFRVENPRLYPAGGKPVQAPPSTRERAAEGAGGLDLWVAAARGGTPSPGSFTSAWPISETVNLWAVAMRTGRRLLYNPSEMRITNVAEANPLLQRQYRAGFTMDA